MTPSETFLRNVSCAQLLLRPVVVSLDDDWTKINTRSKSEQVWNKVQTFPPPPPLSQVSRTRANITRVCSKENLLNFFLFIYIIETQRIYLSRRDLSYNQLVVAVKENETTKIKIVISKYKRQKIHFLI